MFLSEEPENEDDFPDDPMQGLAYLDALVELLIDKGLIDRKDIPAPLPGVRRLTPKMTEDTRRKLQRDLNKIRQESERIEAELRRYSDELSGPEETRQEFSSSKSDEASDFEEEYGPRESIPLYESVAAGRPMEIFDERERYSIPLSQLQGNPADYFAVKVRGFSMTKAGIPDGSIAIIRREQDLISGKIYLLRHEGEYTLKKCRLGDDLKPRLLYEDGTGREIEMREGEDWEIIGMFCFVGGGFIKSFDYL